MTRSPDALLQLTIATIAGAPCGRRCLPLRITFRNQGAAPIRILNHFEPLPVFFSFRILKADGTPLSLPGAGKIDFGPGAPGYLDLHPGDSRDIEVDVGAWLTEALEPGPYSISVTYHNQYGEHCFRGAVRSNTVAVRVPTGGGMQP